MLFIKIYRDIDKFQDLMDDIAEQKQNAEEITNAIITPGRFNCDISDVNKLFRYFNTK